MELISNDVMTIEGTPQIAARMLALLRGKTFTLVGLENYDRAFPGLLVEPVCRLEPDTLHPEGLIHSIYPGSASITLNIDCLRWSIGTKARLDDPATWEHQPRVIFNSAGFTFEFVSDGPRTRGRRFRWVIVIHPSLASPP